MAVSILSDLVITPQANIIGEENTSHVNYAIKKIISEMLEEIICIIEDKQNQTTIDSDIYFLYPKHLLSQLYVSTTVYFRK